MKRLSGIRCGVFKYDKRMPFGGFEIVGGDIRRKDGVTEFIDKDAAEEGHGALSLPRRERTPLSATGAWVRLPAILTTLRLRFCPRKVKLRGDHWRYQRQISQRQAVAVTVDDEIRENIVHILGDKSHVRHARLLPCERDRRQRRDVIERVFSIERLDIVF